MTLGLTRAQLQAFESTLRSTHEMRVTVRIQNLSDDTLSDVSSRLLDGQVNFDSSAESSRQCTLTLDDPDNALNMDSDAPSDGALYADRMMRVDYGVYVDALARWIDVPLFTGPIVAMSRDGSRVELTCVGKEHLARGHAWRPLTLKKGMNTVAAIRTILAERAGEDRFAFPSSNARLPKDVSIGRMSTPWASAVELARSINRQLYYDGAGVCRMRLAPRTSLFTFDGNNVTSDPRVSYDMSEIINTVWLKGGKPRGAKQAVSYATAAPNSHPLSPVRLGRNGTPRYYVELIENDQVRSLTSAKDIATRTLNSKLLEGVTCEFDALPQPHLEPLDVVRLATSDASIAFVLHRASIPLMHSGVMSVGTTKRVTPNRSHIR